MHCDLWNSKITHFQAIGRSIRSDNDSFGSQQSHDFWSVDLQIIIWHFVIIRDRFGAIIRNVVTSRIDVGSFVIRRLIEHIQKNRKSEQHLNDR